MTKDNTAAAAVAELDSVLNQIKTASAKKTAAEMHDQGGGDGGKATSLTSNTPAADDGDRPLAEGERAREDLRDVKDQQELSHENTTGAADSPQFNNAPDETGSVGEADADAEKGKQTQHPDTQYGTTTSHPARTDNSKIAELLKIAEDYVEEEEEAPATEGEGDGEGEGEGGEGGDPIAEAIVAEGEGGEMEPEGPPIPEGEPSEEELMALLGGVPPKMAAAVPDLPSDEESLTKVASEDPERLNSYVEKCSQVYSDDVQDGFQFAANVFASIKEHHNKTAGADDSAQIEALRKQAMADAGNVAEIVEGVEEGGDPGMEGTGDPLAGGDVPLEEEVPSEGGGDAAAEAEALLAALQQSGVGDDAFIKAAAAAGFDQDRAKAVLAKTRKA